ncbi:MerR family transcriptional regulator [Stutzerimonas nitrititolerans]|uniref:MerR family transcriptional regulator n=1 Tax=Stutzerimonas nitrititolerans TaxID=2482751 RepID=UPI002896C69C|nr:MerR family transcriptional regulator [Stutzerimonas nitrititolerans]
MSPQARSGTQLPEGLLPICEVAHQTGVNPATLRGWERRFGLIQPQRTTRGLRLYDAEQIIRIRQILVWLEQGVNISQVSGLLQGPQQAAEPTGASWVEQQQLWLSRIGEFNERALDDYFNQSIALYSAETLCRHLLWPVLEQLQLRWSGPIRRRLEQVFFLPWLRINLGTRVYHSNRLLNGPPLLTLNLSDHVMEPGLWLCAWLASNAGCPVRVIDWSIPVADLSLAISRIGPRAVLLYGNETLEPGYLGRLFDAVDCPQLLCGHAVSIRPEERVVLPNLHLASNPLAALHCLRQLGVLDRP